MEIGNDAQMIILSAMVVCLCLMGVMACVESVSAPGTAMRESAFISDVAVDNVLWSQDSGLEHAATISSIYAWQDRDQAAGRFKQESAPVTDGLSGYLLKHGAAYRFSYDESAAAEYLAEHPRPDAVSIGGVLLEPYEGNARIYGCAYDVVISDGTTSYTVDRVATF
jgi:hypothetical protein